MKNYKIFKNKYSLIFQKNVKKHQHVEPKQQQIKNQSSKILLTTLSHSPIRPQNQSTIKLLAPKKLKALRGLKRKYTDDPNELDVIANPIIYITRGDLEGPVRYVPVTTKTPSTLEQEYPKFYMTQKAPATLYYKANDKYPIIYVTKHLKDEPRTNTPIWLDDKYPIIYITQDLVEKPVWYMQVTKKPPFWTDDKYLTIYITKKIDGLINYNMQVTTKKIWLEDLGFDIQIRLASVNQPKREYELTMTGDTTLSATANGATVEEEKDINQTVTTNFTYEFNFTCCEPLLSPFTYYILFRLLYVIMATAMIGLFVMLMVLA